MAAKKKKVTLSIDADLLAQARGIAKREGKSVSEWAQDGIRMGLSDADADRILDRFVREASRPKPRAARPVRRLKRKSA